MKELLFFRDLETNFLQVFPKAGIALCHHLRIVDAQAFTYKTVGCKGQSHTVVFVGVDGLRGWLTTLTIPQQFRFITVLNHIPQFAHFRLQGLDAVGFLDLQGGEPNEMEGNIHGTTADHKSRSQVAADALAVSLASLS